MTYFEANAGQKTHETRQMKQTQPQDRIVRIMAALGLVFAVGCSQAMVTRAPAAFTDPVLVDTTNGTCFARATTPAVIETVTEQIMVQPAVIDSDGSLRSPAAFRTVTRQRILRERREVEFPTVCAQDQTPEFVASIQRALKTRGYYAGPINGTIDRRTAAALQRFQTAQNDVDTGQLTLKTAQSLGLVALPRDQL